MFDVTISSRIPILRAKGKIIGNTVDTLRREMEKQVEESGGYLILDLADVPLIDSSALGTIIAILQYVKKTDGNLVLLNPQNAVMNVLQVTRLNSVLDIYYDETTALQGLSK